MRLKLRVQEVAEVRGWNAPRIARRADLGDTTVYNLWNGITQDPGLLTLHRIAVVLGVPVTDLYEVISEELEGANDAPTRSVAPALAALV